jgi:Fuc2NAc and GlcNAc transferase
MIYVILFLLSFSLTYFIKNYALKKSLVAHVNERSSHTTPTPHGGGIAIALTWFVGLSYLFYADMLESSLYYALMVGVVLAVVSYLDDLYELSPKVRLLTQAFVALVGLYFLGGFKELDLFAFSLSNQLLTTLFAFFMIVWFINLYNFLDGIDGYAGSEALFLGLAGYFLFGGAHFLVLIAAVFGFLVWNWHKAKIFMGDVGSTLLGYNVAIFTLYYANQDAQNFWVWIILFGVFWFDATLTLMRRKRNKERLSQAHKKHAYQRLTQAGWTHDRVVLFLTFINIVLFVVVLFTPNIWSALILALFILYLLIKFIDLKKAFK